MPRNAVHNKTTISLQKDNMPNSRPVLAEDLVLFRQDFSHEHQVQLCARHLELMRVEMGAEWATWVMVKPGKGKKGTLKPSSTGWTPERVDMAGHFVRHAVESADYWATVDFITHGTLDAIKASRRERPRGTTCHLTQWKQYSHEHMVPGAAVLRLLTSPAYAANRGELAGLLSALSFRALITGTKCKREAGASNQEVAGVDALFGSSLPSPHEISDWNGPANLLDIPPQHYALMRYDAGGLLGELIALTPRAKKAMAGYLTYKASFSVAGASLVGQVPLGRLFAVASERQGMPDLGGHNPVPSNLLEAPALHE